MLKKKPHPLQINQLKDTGHLLLKLLTSPTTETVMVSWIIKQMSQVKLNLTMLRSVLYITHFLS